MSPDVCHSPGEASHYAKMTQFETRVKRICHYPWPIRIRRVGRRAISHCQARRFPMPYRRWSLPVAASGPQAGERPGQSNASACAPKVYCDSRFWSIDAWARWQRPFWGRRGRISKAHAVPPAVSMDEKARKAISWPELCYRLLLSCERSIGCAARKGSIRRGENSGEMRCVSDSAGCRGSVRGSL
jgi:hypothetical protein